MPDVLSARLPVGPRQLSRTSPTRAPIRRAAVPARGDRSARRASRDAALRSATRSPIAGSSSLRTTDTPRCCATIAHALSMAGDHEPPALLAEGRLPGAAFKLDVPRDADFQAVLAYEGRDGLRLRRGPVPVRDARQPCDWSAARRATARTCSRRPTPSGRPRDGRPLPELRSTLDMVLVRRPRPVARGRPPVRGVRGAWPQRSRCRVSPCPSASDLRRPRCPPASPRRRSPRRARGRRAADRPQRGSQAAGGSILLRVALSLLARQPGTQGLRRSR